MKRVVPTYFGESSKDLLHLLGEELKQPLVAISQVAELQGSSEAIHAHARQALHTIDTILLYQRYASGQLSLQLEPVHVGATMQAVAKTMEPLMRANGCHASIVVMHGLRPVDVDRKLFVSALQSLWQAFLGTLQGDEAHVVCEAKRTPRGVYVSVHSVNADLSAVHLAQKNNMSAQPITGLAGSSADLLAAQGMFTLLGSKLNKTTTKYSHGFGVTLAPSRQLQMV